MLLPMSKIITEPTRGIEKRDAEEKFGLRLNDFCWDSTAFDCTTSIRRLYFYTKLFESLR